MTYTVPNTFLELATIEGLPEDIARDYFGRKTHHKKNADDLAYKLVERGTVKDDAAARRSFNRLWRNYQRHNAVGQIKLPDGEIRNTRGEFAIIEHTSAKSDYTYLERAVE